MGRRKRLFLFICIFPAFICFTYLVCVYSIYKKNTQHLLEYELRRLNVPLWLNHNRGKLVKYDSKDHNNFRASNYGPREFQVRSVGKLDYNGRRRPSIQNEKFILVKGDIMSNEGEYLGGFRTDVDRMEDRKKQKRKEKYKKTLTENCRRDVNACRELNSIINQENSSRDGYILRLSSKNWNRTSSSPNGTDGAAENWSPYADKGFTIVGKQDSVMKRLPSVLIIGAKKAGTRALIMFLKVHPSITAAGSELHFFDRFFHRGTSWYRSKLPPSLEGQLTVEKTPSYFVDKDVPERVKKFLPSVKLLLVVRDPVIRAISDYTQSVSKHGMKKSFRELVFKNSTSGLINVGWGPVRGGLYARHYQKWRKFFPKSSIHVVSGEGLVTDPAKEMTDVQEFLNLEKIIKDRHFYFNATKGFPCLMKGEKDGKPHCLGLSKGRTHPKVDEEVLQSLTDFYRPFNAKFYKLVGRNFGWA